VGVAEIVLRQAGVLELRLGDVGHDRMPLALPSLPGLIRQSILVGKILAKTMDARVKPAHDAIMC
jgi:hypothetical protein